MTNSEPLGRNQAMKQLLNKNETDMYVYIRSNLAYLSQQIKTNKLPEDQLKAIKDNLNEILYKIQKELMNGPADSRVSDIMPRSTTQGTSDSTD